ncbi:MAG: hypothetical protein V4658_06365 [Bacteroidota bacterium]
MNKSEDLSQSTPATTPYIRDSLKDDGSVPNMGALNASPDIIPQLSPVDPQYVQQIFGAASYGTDLGKNIEAGQTNYLYMRAINPTTQVQTVNIDVYWSVPGMLIHPSQWKPAQRIGAIQQMTLPPQSVTAAPEPSMWAPAQLPTGGHYCLILELSWNGQPGIPTEFPNIDAWWNYCRQNNNIAQRNIDIVDDLPNNRVERSVNLLNPDPNVRNHTIEAICNVPLGSQVSLFCPSPGLQPPINVSSPITQSPQTISTPVTAFPPNFQGTLQLVFQPPGKTVPGSYSIVIQQFGDISSPLAKSWNGPRSTVNGELVLLGSYIFEINI